MLVQCTCCKCEFEFEIPEDVIDEILQNQAQNYADGMSDTYD